MLYLFGSFFEDEGSPSLGDREFTSAVDILIDTGLLPTPSLRQLVNQSSKHNFKLQVPTKLASIEIGKEKSTQAQDTPIPFFVDRLKAIAERFRSESRHILVLDGLDDILSRKQVQYESLAALIFEVSRLNSQFYKSGTPAKIIVLCRTDLYEKLPGTNKNKIRQDSAEMFDWFHNPNTPKELNLIKMVNNKVKVGNPEIEDIFAEYLPSTWTGYYGEPEDIRSFLLSWTRHTPRDFIQLLRFIQKSSNVGILTVDQIWNGIRTYSYDYFLPEIKDEMAGYVSVEDIDASVKLLISLRKREFTFKTLYEAQNEQAHLSNLDIAKILGVMFECSAIGNTTQRGSHNRYSFKYRNRHDSLNINERLVVHRGLWKAMNFI